MKQENEWGHLLQPHWKVFTPVTSSSRVIKFVVQFNLGFGKKKPLRKVAKIYTHWGKVRSSTYLPLPCFDPDRQLFWGWHGLLTLAEKKAVTKRFHISAMIRAREVLFLWIEGKDQAKDWAETLSSFTGNPESSAFHRLCSQHLLTLTLVTAPQALLLSHHRTTCTAHGNASTHHCLAHTYSWPSQKEWYPCAHDGKQYYFSSLFYAGAYPFCTAKVKSVGKPRPIHWNHNP